MDALAIAAVVAGAVLMVAVLVDLVFTTIHPDIEGVLASRVQRWTWKIATWGPSGERGRRVLALAGPAMMAVTFVIWLGCFILGFALVIWPFVDEAYRAEPEMTGIGFGHALYYSGVTVTVLGYGDITPLRWPLQLMTFVASASGFALLTGIVTYIIQLVTTLNERILLALRIDDDTEGSADGVALVLTALQEETIDDARGRLEQLSDMVRAVHDRLHRLPMVGLFYRSRDPAKDPEPALKAALEASVAARLVSLDGRYSRLGPVARSLDRSCQRLVFDMTAQYLSNGLLQDLKQGRVDDDARSTLNDIRARLMDGAGVMMPSVDAMNDDIPVLIYRTRRFLDGLNELTRWRDHRLVGPG